MRQHKQVSALNRRPTSFIWCVRLHCSPSSSSTSNPLSSQDKRGLGLTAHIIDHCNLILKYPEGTNSSWYRNMTTVLTREYLDSRPGGWMDYAPQRIAQLGTKKCTNKNLCEENLNVLLPAKPPFHPRQFRTCAVFSTSLTTSMAVSNSFGLWGRIWFWILP